MSQERLRERLRKRRHLDLGRNKMRLLIPAALAILSACQEEPTPTPGAFLTLPTKPTPVSPQLPGSPTPVPASASPTPALPPTPTPTPKALPHDSRYWKGRGYRYTLHREQPPRKAREEQPTPPVPTQSPLPAPSPAPTAGGLMYGAPPNWGHGPQ
jgi:hypothetical protein